MALASTAHASGFCEVNDPGSAAFIRNSYVELGLGSEGAFGESGYPSGWHYRSNTGQLGFVANPQANGWTSYYGDFFSPGSPLEGWGLEVGGVSYTNFNGSASVAGSLGDPACEVDICGNLGGAVDWTGALGDLGIQTQYGVVNDDVFIVMTVTLTNNGTSTLSDVHWFRNVDPDNSVMTGHGYHTTNVIISQPGASTDLASVKATGGDGADLYLMASDSRARVTHGGFYNTDASDIWSGSGFYSSVGESVSDDAAISLSVRIGDMAPGQTETFRVIYALDETAVVSATDCAEAPVEPDADGDGVPDATDTCPSDPLNDVDGDGICGDSDTCEGHDDLLDSDEDGIADGCDTCPNDPLDDEDSDGICGDFDTCPGHSDLVDSDGDGTPDGCDICIYDPLDDEDGDTVCGNNEVCPGSDDLLDTDADFTPDGCDTCPFDALGDSDADGSCDSDDICSGADDLLDTDGDGIPNGCDTCPDDSADDSDGDGSCDSADNCPGFDDFADADSDGLSDDCDACPLDELNDVDADGVCGDVDACPSDSLDDRDGDGMCESSDSCPLDPENDADGDEACADVDPCPYDAANDIDSDGICGDVDVCPEDGSNDADADDVCDGSDACPDDPTNDVDEDGVCGLVDNCPEVANDQADVDDDGIGDVCDPTDDRPVDTGDTGDTGTDTGVDTGNDTGADSAVDSAIDSGELPGVDPPAGKYVPGGCSTTGTGGPSGGLILLGAAFLASVRRRGVGILTAILGAPLLMGASGGEVPEMSVIPLPPRGAQVFKGEETSIVIGVVTDPLSYVNPDGTETVVIGDTGWGWVTKRYTTDHLSFDVGLPASLADDGVPRVGDAWAGARGSTKAFNVDGWGAYGDLAVVVPTGVGLGVAQPSVVAQIEAGAEGNLGNIGILAGGGYLVYPSIDLEGYTLGDGPYLNGAASYSVSDFTVGLDAQAFYNVGQSPLSSLFAGASIDWASDNLTVGVAASKGLIRQPGDPDWQAMMHITFSPPKKAEPLPPIIVQQPCACKSETVMEQPIVIVVPEKVDTSAPPRQEIGIGFKAGDTTLTPKAKATLDGVWVILGSRPSFGVKVVGYADSAEIEYKHPEELSYERAKASADYLIAKGLTPDRISIEGKGDTAPLDTSGTPAGQALNRRVEFVVVIAAKPTE